MTKQEKIKEAYGLYWKDYGHLADDNGFIYQSDLFYPDTEMKKQGVEIEIISVEHKHKWSNIKWRPKTLSGIEDNNGWIKIESEEDAPVNEGIYWVMRLGCNFPLHLDTYNDLHKRTWFGKYTHYKPIEKPKPPIH